MADRDLSGRTLGEFVLDQKIGQGGMGAVYRAAQPLLQRSVVVKVLSKADNLAEQRFLREAQLASRLDHPFVAHIYAFGVDADEGVLWIAMELVQGLTLSEWIEQHGPMPLEQFVPFFECIADAVHTAHECGIVHRDLKPSNVMVVERGARVLPKLLDFGIAKMHDQASEHPPLIRTAQMRPHTVYRTASDPPGGQKQRITRSRIALGSRPYMSPEQWVDAQAVGPASDVYSLGILVYETLAGRLPYIARNTEELYRLHLNAEPPKLQIDGIPRDVDRVLRVALAKCPEDRYRSPLEMAAELREALQAQPRERLRSLARVWNNSARSSALLLRGGDLLNAPTDTVGELERAFVKASRRHTARLRGALVALAALVAMGALLVHVEGRRRMADELAIESEVEQGRQSLLHGESGEAMPRLAHAYENGDRSPAVAFMLARAMQPRMSEIARFTGRGQMWSGMFSPDGKQVLTTDSKGAQMWDAASGQLLFTMDHEATVFRAVFDQDGARIVTAGGDGTVRIWNAVTGALIRELAYRGPDAKRWSYSVVAVSSHLVAAIDVMGRSAHVWDEETGALLADLGNLADDASEKALLAFSPDGRWLVASGGDDVRIFDATTWQRVGAIAGPRVRSLSFAPTGLLLAVGTYDGVASIWEIPSGVRVRSLREGGASVDALAFSRDGALVETASRDGTEQVWEVASGGLRTQFNAHHDKIYAVEFSRNADLVLSAGADGAVAISTVATGMIVARLEGPKKLVIAAHFDAEAHRVVGASWDGTVRVWNAASPYRRWVSPQVGAECDTEDSLIPDGRFVALSCRGHGTHIWDTANGELLTVLPAVTRASGSSSSALPALTANGDRAAIAHGNTVEVYALPSGHLLRTIVHRAAVTGVGFAPAGHDVISGAIDGSLLITRDGDDPAALPPSSAGIDAVALVAGGRAIVADAGRRLRVLGPDRRTLMDVATPTRIRLLRAASDGGRLVTISATNEPASPGLWDLNHYLLITRLEGHEGRVFTARFAEVGGKRELLTTGADGTVRLWDVATGQPGQSFRGDSHFIVDAAIAPDGLVIVGGGSDGALRFWDTSSGRLLWMLQAHTSYVIGVHYEGNELVTRGFVGDVARWGIPSSDEIIEACRASACASGEPVGK